MCTWRPDCKHSAQYELNWNMSYSMFHEMCGNVACMRGKRNANIFLVAKTGGTGQLRRPRHRGRMTTYLVFQVCVTVHHNHKVNEHPTWCNQCITLFQVLYNSTCFRSNSICNSSKMVFWSFCSGGNCVGSGGVETCCSRGSHYCSGGNCVGSGGVKTCCSWGSHYRSGRNCVGSGGVEACWSWGSHYCSRGNCVGSGGVEACWSW
jgi:hypothetical protein